MDPVLQNFLLQEAIYPTSMVILYLLNLCWAIRTKNILPDSYQEGWNQVKTMTRQQVRDEYNNAEKTWNRRHTQPARPLKEKTVNELEQAINELITSHRKLEKLKENKKNLLAQLDRNPVNLNIIRVLESVNYEIRKTEQEIGLKPSVEKPKQNPFKDELTGVF
jgi:hypothetical protein